LIYFSNDFGKVLEVGFWDLGGLIMGLGFQKKALSLIKRKAHLRDCISN
jgi:hypothetical protein